MNEAGAPAGEPFHVRLQEWLKEARQQGDAARAELLAAAIAAGEDLRRAREALDARRAAAEVAELRGEIETICHAAFVRSGNPLYAWQAIALHRDDGDIPAWARDCLQAAAQELLALARSRQGLPSDVAESVPKALGLTRAGWNAFEDYSEFARQFAATVDLAITPGKRGFAAKEVAASHRVSLSTVWRWQARVRSYVAAWGELLSRK